MKHQGRQLLGTLTALAWDMCAAAGVHAHAIEAAWPSKPITVTVPYPLGGTNDLIADQVSKRSGQPVIIEYKPGADGTIGAQYVTKA